VQPVLVGRSRLFESFARVRTFTRFAVDRIFFYSESFSFQALEPVVGVFRHVSLAVSNAGWIYVHFINYFSHTCCVCVLCHVPHDDMANQLY
jgi:hypothetical protein